MKLETPVYKRITHMHKKAMEERALYDPAWKELADYIFPHRFTTLNSGNKAKRLKSIRNDKVVNSHGSRKAKTLGTSLLGAVTPPYATWFEVEAHNDNDPESINKNPEVQNYLTAVGKKMAETMRNSNVYSGLGVNFGDLGVFANGCMLIDEDDDDVARTKNPSVGSYAFITDGENKVIGLAITSEMSVEDILDTWPDATDLPPQVERIKTQQEFGFGKDYQVNMLVIPTRPEFNLPSKFKYARVAWMKAQQNDHILKIDGYAEQPFCTSRWEVVDNATYGVGPGDMALMAIKQLQKFTLSNARAVDLMLDPPLALHPALQNSQNPTYPGAKSFVPNLTRGSAAQPIKTVQYDYSTIQTEFERIKSEINECFFTDLFRLIVDLGTVRSAEEIRALLRERLLLLSTVLENYENDTLDPLLSRIYGICLRKNLFPPMPAELDNDDVYLTFKFTGILSDAQNAANISNFDTFIALTSTIANLDPNVIDKIDLSNAPEILISNLRLPETLLRTKEQLDALINQKAQEAEAAQLTELAKGIAAPLAQSVGQRAETTA